MTPSDDSFHFRGAPDKTPPEADYYVFADCKEQGPFALAGLCPLIRAGIFPRSTQYRIDGISDWAPISELDEKTRLGAGAMQGERKLGVTWSLVPHPATNPPTPEPLT